MHSSANHSSPELSPATFRRAAAHLSLALPLIAGIPVMAKEVKEAPKEEKSLAYEIQNPFAFIPRLPIENQFDFGFGSLNSMQYSLRPRPVIPFSLSQDLALISRTTFNIIYKEGAEPGVSDEFGLGDTDVELWVSPKTTIGGWVFGFGPIVRIPTGTDDLLGGGKWGAGPTAAAIRQVNGWTYGVFVNHLWGFAGQDNRADLNVTYLQPLVSYTTKRDTTFGVDTQSTYDWNIQRWTVPFNLTVSQLFHLGGTDLVVTLGGRVYAERPPGGPDWGCQLSFNVLFGK